MHWSQESCIIDQCCLTLSKVEYRDRRIVYYPENINIRAWTELAALNNGKLLLSMGGKPYISCRVKNKDFALDIATRLLKQYLKIIAALGLSNNKK